MRRYLTEIIILTLISSILIFYKFNQIPKNLSYDEVEFTKLAISLNKKPYTPYSNLATGHSTLYFYIILLSFNIFGINNFALRFPSALFGVANVLLFYFIMRKIFNKNNSLILKSSDNSKNSNYQLPITNYLPLILSFIFLTSRWYFNFARFGFEATFLLFFELASSYFFLKYLKSTKIDNVLFAAFFAGLAFNSYTPGRIFFLLSLIFLIKQFNNFSMKQLVMGLFVFVLVISPLAYYLLTHADTRFNQQFFLKNSNESIHRKAEFLWSNIKSAVLMFNFRGDINGRHNFPGKPALNPTLGLFFVGGIVLALKNYANFYNQFFLLYFLISLIPSLLTYPWENPNMLRTFTVIPSIIFFVGRAVEFLARSNLKKSYKKYLIFFILFLLVLSSIYEIRTYFKYQSKVFEQAFEVKKDLKSILR